MSNSWKRVVITGVSVVSPLGNNLKEAFNRLKTYKNCVEYDKSLENYKNLYTRLSSRVHGFIMPENLTRKVLRTMGKVSIDDDTGQVLSQEEFDVTPQSGALASDNMSDKELMNLF